MPIEATVASQPFPAMNGQSPLKSQADPSSMSKTPATTAPHSKTKEHIENKFYTITGSSSSDVVDNGAQASQYVSMDHVQLL